MRRLNFWLGCLLLNNGWDWIGLDRTGRPSSWGLVLLLFVCVEREWLEEEEEDESSSRIFIIDHRSSSIIIIIIITRKETCGDGLVCCGFITSGRFVERERELQRDIYIYTERMSTYVHISM